MNGTWKIVYVNDKFVYITFFISKANSSNNFQLKLHSNMCNRNNDINFCQENSWELLRNKF